MSGVHFRWFYFILGSIRRGTNVLTCEGGEIVIVFVTYTIPNLLRLYEFLKKRGITTKMYDEFFNFIDDQMIRAHEEASKSDIHFDTQEESDPVYTPEELEEALTKAMMNTNAKSN